MSVESTRQGVEEARVTHEGQFEYEVFEDGRRIDGRVVDDPFLVTTIRFEPSRWEALRWLFRPLVKEYRVRVGGMPAAYRVVFTGDYTPPEPLPEPTTVGYEWSVEEEP